MFGVKINCSVRYKAAKCWMYFIVSSNFDFFSYFRLSFEASVGMCFDICLFFDVLTTPLYIYSLARGGGCIDASIPVPIG